MNIDDEIVAGGWSLSCWVEFVAVPGRAGVSPDFQAGQRLGDGSVVVTSEEVDDEFPFPSFISRTFPDGRAAAAWFRQSGHTVPADVLRALRANDLKALDDGQQKMTVGQRPKWSAALVTRKSVVTSFLRGLLALRRTTTPDDARLEVFQAYRHGRDFAHRVTFHLFERVAG